MKKDKLDNYREKSCEKCYNVKDITFKIHGRNNTKRIKDYEER